MMFFTGGTMCEVAARDMCEEFRKIRNEARTALLDKDSKAYVILKQQLESLLQLEFVDKWGSRCSIMPFLDITEKLNPLQLSPMEFQQAELIRKGEKNGAKA